MLHWLWVIIIGFLAGLIAKWFVPGPHGFIVTTLLGIVGAIIATWLGNTSVGTGRVKGLALSAPSSAR